MRHELIGLATGLTGDSDLAEDLVQRVFARLLERVQRADPPTLSDDYFRVALRNLLRDRSRRVRVRRERRPQVKAALPSVRTPHDELDDRMLRDVMDEAHADLPPRLREAFALFCRRGMSGSEAAEELGVSVATVYTQVKQAKERMRSALEARGVREDWRP